jgi:hypothetical protein
VSHAHIEIKPEELKIPDGHAWSRLPALGAGLAGLGALVCLALSLAEGGAQRFYFSFLVAFMFATTLGLGALFFVLLQHAVSAGWSITLRRLAENLAGALPFVLPVFLLVLMFGIHHLYDWSHEDAASDHFLMHKLGYLSSGAFTVRALIYMALWIAMALIFLRHSVRQDETGDRSISLKLRTLSYPAIAVFALSLHFAGLDWAMSVDPHWFSTIFGVYIFAGSLVSAFALLSLLAVAIRWSGLVSKDIITTEHLHDIGKLTFAFTAFWAYIAFSQFFLYWYANIPEETMWYAHRWEGSWKSVSILLGLGQFVIPFFFLMSRHIKRNPLTLSLACVWILFIHYVDMYWLVMPKLYEHGPEIGLMDISTLMLTVGLLIWGFGFWSRRHALVPVQDPRLQESIAFQNF